MDTSWVKRLVGVGDDVVLGQSFLLDYARALRLLSGISSSSLGRVLRDAHSRRRDQRFRDEVLSSDAVVSFITFLRSFQPSELPVVLELLCRELYPGSQGSTPKKAIGLLTRLVATIQRGLQGQVFQNVDFVIQRVNQDPMLFAQIRDLQVVLNQLSIQTRFSLLSYGQRWSLAFDSISVDRDVATVFLQFVEIPSRPPPQAIVHRSRPKGDEGRDGRKRGRSPPAGHGPPKSRRVFEGTRPKRVAGRKRSESCPPILTGLAHDPIDDSSPQVCPAEVQETLNCSHAPVLVVCDDMVRSSEADRRTTPVFDGPPTGPLDAVSPGRLEPWPCDVLTIPRHLVLDALQDEDEIAFQDWSSTQGILQHFENEITSAPGHTATQVIAQHLENGTARCFSRPPAEDDNFEEVSGKTWRFQANDEKAIACPSCSSTLPWTVEDTSQTPGPGDTGVLPSTHSTGGGKLPAHPTVDAQSLNECSPTPVVHGGSQKVLVSDLPLGPPSVQPVIPTVRVIEDLAIFKDLRLTSLGGFCGTTVAFPDVQCRLQFMHSADCRAYMDACPRILELFAGLGGWKQAIRSMRPDDLVISIEIDATRAKNKRSLLPRSKGFDVPPDEASRAKFETEGMAKWDKKDLSPVPEHHLVAPTTPEMPVAMASRPRPAEQFVEVQEEDISGEPKRRRTRWEADNQTPNFQFQLAFTPSGSTPKKAIGLLTRLVATIQRGLQGQVFQNVDFVIQRVNQDPMLFAQIRDLQVVLNQLSIQTRFSLLSYGQRWSLAFDSISVDRDVATVFLQFVEIPSRPPPQAIVHRSRPKGDEGRDGRKRGRSPPAGHGPPKSRRVFEGTRPKRVAGRKRSLDLTHLMKKGIFTWLVADDAFPFGVRFLHAFEAARCLGFQTDLRLPSDQSFAMQLLGNCVSPVQAIWALSQVLPTTCEPYEVACGWLFHQLPLHSLRVVVFEDDMFLVQSIPLGRPHFLKADVQMISCDGALFPVPSPLVHSRTRASCTLPLATPWTILELGRWLHEDTLLLIARVIPLQVIIGDVPILLSPFASLDVLAPFLKDHAPSHLETNPLWTWFTGDDPVFRWPDQQLVVDPPRVFLTAGTHVKAVPWVEGQTIAQCIANTFHYRHLRLAVAVSLEGRPIDTQSLVQPFQSIQCQFAPQQVFIEPYGAFTLDPMTRVSIVARMISDLRFGGRASVRLTCNGKLLSPELFIGYADSLGVLRAKVFALPGGAPSLAAQMENLQTLLVQHGHPASTSKAKSDEIFNKLGQTKLKVIAESKTPWIQLKAEASAHKIVLIPPEHRGQAKSSEDPLLANDPWLAGRNRDSKTAKKKQAPKPPPSKVDISFFHADGCPVAQIELPKLLQGSRGLVVTDLKSFRDHVDSALAANMTVGPSGVLLLGVVPSQIVSSPSARVQALAVPGWLGSSPTAFKATLIQTGDAPLSTRTLQELKLPEARQTHRVAQIHVFKDETDTWSTLVSQGIVSYLKSLGYPHFGSISQTWSLDFFHRGKKAEPEQASYYHGFLKLDATHFEQLLKLGGISGFYPNPRSESRGPDTRYRTIMLRGLTLAETRSAAAKVSSLGLTRGKHGYGVRALAEDYSESRKKLFPQGVESSDSEPGGPRKFQLLGVPDSVNRSVLKQALAAMGWSFPLKDEMVMVVESSHSKASGPILGATSKHFRASTVHLGPLETQATSVCPQSVATKFEQLDSQATARVTTLEQKFEALAESVASSQVATSKSVNELAQSVSTLNNHVQEQARAYDQQLKTMFGQLAKKQDDGFEALERASELTLKGLRQEHQNAMKSMRQDFETSYKELRDIFTHSPKARKVTAESSDGQPGAAMAGSTFGMAIAATALYSGSFRHRLNSQLLDWAWAILSEVSGPACLVGDFNSPWEAYDVGETLAAKGWVDLHAFWAEQKGQDPQPTCKQATRHTFILGNPSFRPFVTDVTVDFEDSLDSHSVLLAKISCPTCNPLVWKWLLPQSLDQCSFDPLLAQETPDQDWLDEFQPLLQAGDLSKAFQHWSQSAEAVLVRAARLNDAPVPAGRFSGRAQQLHPVRRALAAPRFKQGRSSDFCVDHHANTLLVRQVQRQARRLQNLGRLLRSPVRPVTHNKISELWQAILASTGFGRSFPNWLLSQVDFIHLSPTVACVETVTQVVLAHANRLASQSWRAWRKHFSDCLETSWTSDGGRLPFKMVREAPLPPVQKLEMVIPLLLAPQRWSPIGKAWIPFVNADPIPIGAELTWVGGSCHVLDKVGTSLQVSVRLTRREASQLVYRKVSLDPNEWAPFFLTQWEQYWKRDQVDDVQVPQPLIDALPAVPPMEPFTLDFSDWCHAVQAAKTHTMRGVDGWSAVELKALPEGWVLPLLRLFSVIAGQGHWPRQLSIWLLILLRKTDASVADWSALRPISVASLTYRIWSRMCTFHMMRHARPLALPFVAPHISTRSIWGWLAERIACQYRQRSTMSGLVLDIVKCFNVLPRCILFAIMRRLGFDGQTLSVWALQLSGLERTLYIDTCVYGASTSSTGVPEGDPLSVVAMYSMSLAFAFYLSVHSPLLPLAFADNWEALSVSSQELLQALPTVETFLGLCRLPVSVSKCWVWAITKSERKALKQARLNDSPLPASKAVFGSHKGSSPWLACLLGTYRCIDPQFILLMNRIALFRQMVKELPSQASFLTAQLARTGRYRGPTSRLVTVLGDLGWGHQAEGAFVDQSGRTFHLLLTPLPHVEALLLSSWTQEVARRTSHRKYLAALDTIDVSLSTSFRHLPMSERSLLQRQHSGAFFTGEFLKHTGSTDQCRFCQQQDTRIHRLLHCPRIQSLLASFPLLVRNRDAIPLRTWAHGLWEEPPLWRPWQALLDSLTLPEIARSDCTSPVYLYSDGACLRPKCSHASLAAAAVVKAAADGTFEVVWSGRLPGSLQTPFRAELLAGAVAFASHQEVHFFSDCLAFVKVARRLLLAAQRGLDPVFPLTHLDLWTFFWVCLQGATVASCAITWVPSHKDYRKLSGIERVHAWFNGCVDKIARESARLAICPLFLDLVAQVDLLRQAATQLASFQAGVAKIFANERPETPDREPSLPGDLVPQAPVQVPSEVVLDFSSVPCPSFARQLLQWLLSLRWTPSAIDPASRQIWSDTSFLELFWAFVWSTGVLPPFRHDGAWVLPQDDPLLIFVQPCFCVLFRSWKRQLDILVRLGFIPCWASARSVTASAGSLGARFPCPGVDGRALVPFESLLSLAAALRCARRLSALALPITVN
eukprot:Skav202009  [mRNA]  locus=scaffold1829:120856:132547:- [translate_table: standard]